MIPIARLSLGQEEADAAAEAVLSGWLMQGKRVAAFEGSVAAYVGARHAIATTSCTTALQLALLGAGVQPGDEVICPSFSFIATANAIIHAGATPVFVDIDARTYNIDPALIEQAITPRTTAIMPVSQIGLPADIPAILDIARRYNLKDVEDEAPALGATLGEAKIGSLSDFSCFSFDARKILTTGEGGMITTDDDEAAGRMKLLRAHASSISSLARHTSTSVSFEEYRELGYNFKMTEIQAAIGLVQMGKVEQIVAERRRLAARYQHLLGEDTRLALPYAPPGTRHVYQSYCVRLIGERPRIEIMEELAEQGIATRKIQAIHEEPYYRRIMPGVSLPETEAAAAQTILLPLFVGLTDQEQDEVASALKKALR
jgi:dTDP-4-amino-4,6-dideoxygalactose transaminase